MWHAHEACVVRLTTCLWDSGACDSMIKKSYVHKFHNKFETKKQGYNTTAAGVYTSNHNVKINITPMLEFLTCKVIKHHFHINDVKVWILGLWYNYQLGSNNKASGVTVDFPHTILPLCGKVHQYLCAAQHIYRIWKLKVLSSRDQSFQDGYDW